MFATCVRTRRCSFATARSIAKLKPPLCSAESKLPIGVKIPFSKKCGEWVIYPEPVTYYQHVDSGGFCLIGVHSKQAHSLTHYWHPHPLKWCNTLVVPEVGNPLTSHDRLRVGLSHTICLISKQNKTNKKQKT